MRRVLVFLSTTAARDRRCERGQVTLLAAAVLAIAVLCAGALAIGARVLVERATASSAADSIALAAVVDPVAAAALADDLGVVYDAPSPGTVTVTVGDVSATASASTDRVIEVAPALAAVVARAEQLLGADLSPRWFPPDGVRVVDSQHSAFSGVAPALGLCEAAADVFRLC